MNIEYAQTIELRAILNKMGLQEAAEKTTGILLYPSFMNEAAPLSLQVNTTRNSWHDSSTGAGGGPAELVAAWLDSREEPCALPDVLHWLKFTIGYPLLASFMEQPDQSAVGSRYRIASRVTLQEGSLIRYAVDMGFSVDEAIACFQQLYIANRKTGHEFVALGFRNEDGGYSIYNRHTEMHLAPYAITFIRGKAKPDTVHVFKDIFDYCAAIRERNGKPFAGDSIILNSWQSLDNAAAYIRGYGYRNLCSWLADNPAGIQASAALDFLARTEPDLIHTMMHIEEPQ